MIRSRADGCAGDGYAGKVVGNRRPLTGASPGFYYYVVDESGDIWIHEGKGDIKHSSLMPTDCRNGNVVAGAPVKMAGCLVINDQMQVFVNCSSGHYMMGDPFLGPESSHAEAAMHATILASGLKVGWIDTHIRMLPQT